jgi:hypothetical protein
MNETYDKSMPIHDPQPVEGGPREIFPFQKIGNDRDFRPLNTIDYADPVEVGEDEEAEVEEVLTAPKDSPVPESVESSTSEPPTTPPDGSPEPPASPASAEKDNGQPKEPESGSQTSSLPPMIGDVELPASTEPQGAESPTPGSPARRS